MTPMSCENLEKTGYYDSGVIEKSRKSENPMIEMSECTETLGAENAARRSVTVGMTPALVPDMTAKQAKRFSKLQTLIGMSILRGEYCTALKQLAEMEKLVPPGDNYHRASYEMARAALEGR